MKENQDEKLSKLLTRRPLSASIRQSRFLPAMFLIACGIFLAAAITEGILRFVPGLLSIELQQVIRIDPDNYGIAHPYIGYLNKPNNTLIIEGRDFRAVSHTDGYGFRNAWPWPKRAEVVALGDSLTFGYGVEDNQAWPAILASGLPNSRLINLGLSGAGPQQYFRLYETFGAILHPQLVLIGFFAGNDFADSDTFDRWLTSGANVNFLIFRDFGKPKSTSLSLDQPMGDLVSALLWRIHLFATKSRLYSLAFHLRKMLKSGSASTGILRAPNGLPLNLSVRGFAQVMKNARPGSRPFKLTIDALARLHSRTKADGASVLIVLQPTKEEVYLPLTGEAGIHSDLGRPLREALEKLGIPYIDLVPAFRDRAAKGEVLFFENDGHPNARGYALISDLVLHHLRNNAQIYGLAGLARTR